jgi:2-methylisocitrate lyase-like PEP mutase family enzyme
MNNFTSMHHQDELLFLPNAWDTLSAIVLEQAGFKAIGTTSWGIANAMGYNDGEKIEFSLFLNHVANIIANVTMPVTVDVESGYSTNKEVVAENVLKIANLGAVGINIEDSLKSTSGLVDIQSQCDLLSTIRHKLDSNGYQDFFINARTDTYLQLNQPLNETLSRAMDYIAHGANGIFVPGLQKEDEIITLVSAIPAPLNVMSLPNLTDISYVNSLGVKRFSLGNSLSDSVTGFIEQKAQELLSEYNSERLYQGSPLNTQFKSA